MPRVVRVIIYECEEKDMEVLESIISKCVPDGHNIHWGDSGLRIGVDVKVAMHIQTIIDERKSQQWPKANDPQLNALVDKALEEM